MNETHIAACRWAQFSTTRLRILFTPAFRGKKEFVSLSLSTPISARFDSRERKRTRRFLKESKIRPQVPWVRVRHGANVVVDAQGDGHARGVTAESVLATGALADDALRFLRSLRPPGTQEVAS